MFDDVWGNQKIKTIVKIVCELNVIILKWYPPLLNCNSCSFSALISAVSLSISCLCSSSRCRNSCCNEKLLSWCCRSWLFVSILLLSCWLPSWVESRTNYSHNDIDKNILIHKWLSVLYRLNYMIYY